MVEPEKTEGGYSVKKEAVARRLTDDEAELEEFDDSYFGLSDSQLDELWQRFDETVMACGREDSDEETCRVRALTTTSEAPKARSSVGSDYSDFGLSSRQLDELRWKFRRATSEDCEEEIGAQKSVKSVASEKNSKGEGLPPESDSTDSPPIRAKSRRCTSIGQLEDFLESELPRLTVQSRSPDVLGTWHAVVVSTRDVRGSSWYLLRVITSTKTKYCMKQHADLRELDTTLRWVTGSRKNVNLPIFPEDVPTENGTMQGLLGVGSKTCERKKTLQMYLNGVAEQLPPPTDEPVLGDFFGL